VIKRDASQKAGDSKVRCAILALLAVVLRPASSDRTPVSCGAKTPFRRDLHTLFTALVASGALAPSMKDSLVDPDGTKIAQGTWSLVWMVRTPSKL
jgi:hypothetical protein